MQLASLIRHVPRPFEEARGREVLRAFSGVPSALDDLIIGAAGSSPYLASIMSVHSDWLSEAFGDVEGALAKLTREVTPETLRIAKARLAALVALADLGGAFSLEQVTLALSDFADRACDVALNSLLAEAKERKRLPEDAGLAIFAMGKWGAHELNYSSDIDLICLFDHHDLQGDELAFLRSGLVRVVRRLCAILSDVTDQGYVFRTDLRLRPDASVTPVCLPYETALRYYESVGRTWERAAWIKARLAVGDQTGGTAFLSDLQPFVWRKHLDFAAIADAHDIRLRIRSHLGQSLDPALEGHNVKLGRGGIREIEFFAQTRQLIAGGRDPGLRQRGTLAALSALADKGWVETDAACELADHYRAHRLVEHRLQMIGDMQTHDLPRNDEGFARLACLMGTEVATLRAELTHRFDRVSELTEGFFDPGQSRPRTRPERTKRMEEIMAPWLSYPAFRTERAVELFSRIEARLMAGLSRAADPDYALLRLDEFLRALPAGVQLFSLFAANPNLVDLIADICAASPALARYLGRNARVLDYVIAGDFFAPLPEAEALLGEFRRAIAGQDFETALLTLRRLRADWHFRIGVHHLRGLTGVRDSAAAYARLADAVLAVLMPVVIAETERRHGNLPGSSVALLGMGSLGVSWLTARSDLDLIVVHDCPEGAVSEGKALSPQAWFARLTQTLVTALSAPMEGGRLYEVDMRLRPSGRQGPVATALSTFRDYQMQEAWTWEHLALTRARVVFGTGGLADRLEAVRREVISLPRKTGEVLRAVADMRERLAQAKGSAPVYDVKTGAGGLTDIELLASACGLLARDPTNAVTEQIAQGARLGIIDQADRLVLIWGKLQAWRTTAALLGESVAAPEDLGAGALALFARDCGMEADHLVETLSGLRAEAAALVDSACRLAAPALPAPAAP